MATKKGDKICEYTLINVPVFKLTYAFNALIYARYVPTHSSVTAGTHWECLISPYRRKNLLWLLLKI